MARKSCCSRGYLSSSSSNYSPPKKEENLKTAVTSPAPVVTELEVKVKQEETAAQLHAVTPKSEEKEAGVKVKQDETVRVHVDEVGK